MFSDLGFIIKLVEFLFCLAGAIIGRSSEYYASTDLPSVKHVVVIAVCTHLMIVLIFELVFIFDGKTPIMEIVFFTFGGLINVVAGILLIFLYQGIEGENRPLDNCLLIVTTITCGFLMICDVIRVFMDTSKR